MVLVRGPAGGAVVLAEAVQTTLDEAVPLSEVTFCVVDLETTGGSPTDARITEIGAVTYRGGERIGVFETLVDPRVPIPPFITHLTGIDDRAVRGAPGIGAVLPSFAEFARGCIFVAHNARFDFTFLNVALGRSDREPLPGPPICTARLARRIVWPDVPNVRLQTLAEYFRTATQPIHRALADAQACAEVLHGLLDLGRRLGIVTLGDVHQAVRARGRPNFGKIGMAERLPGGPGVYLFRARDGRILYVGKSKDIRSRVKRYFYGDGRKKIEGLLSETVSVHARPCVSELEALVLEARLIRTHEPPYNRRGRTWRRYAYLRIDPTEAFPRIKIVREARTGDVALGPFASSQQARLAKEALEEAFPLRRCTRGMRRTTRFPPCALAGIGRCLSPCDGSVGLERYGELVRSLISSLTHPDELLATLEERMRLLTRQERFEEAIWARDRLRALAEALLRRRQEQWLLRPGHLELVDAGGSRIRFRDGALVHPGPTDDGREDDVGVTAAGTVAYPYPRERADEVSAARSWLQRNEVRVIHAEQPPWEPADGGRLDALVSRLRAADVAGRRSRAPAD